MYVAEDIGKKLPYAVYYDLDNSALEHAARIPTQDTVRAIGILAGQGTEMIPVTGRDIDDCEDAVMALGARFAIIDGGATVLDIASSDRSEPAIRHAWESGFDLGRPLDDMDVARISESIDTWITETPSESSAHIRIPGYERHSMWWRGHTDNARFTTPTTMFVSKLSSTEIAENLATDIRRGYHHFKPLYASRVTAQDGSPEAQITRDIATKAHAIRELARQVLPIFQQSHSADYEEDLRNSIFIGDGMNDLSAFEAAGFRVAMADAPTALLSRADLVIPPYGEGGFVSFIENLTITQDSELRQS